MPQIARRFFLLSIWFLALSLQGGPVSLKTNEFVRLREFIAGDPAAGAQFALVRAVADRALLERPDPVTNVISEGHLETDPKKIRTVAALKDQNKAESLAWAWVVTGSEKYASQARQILLAWAKMNKPDGDSINESKFEPMIIAYDLLRETFSKTDRQIMDSWWRNKAETLWKSNFSVGVGGNWYSHRLKVVGLIGLMLGDQTMITEVKEGFHKQIPLLIKPDGATGEFYVRDSLHYQVYSIDPLLSLAYAMERCGVEDFFDYHSPNGPSMHTAVDFVVPFAEGSKTHMEFVNSKSSFDRKRAAGGESRFQPHLWEPSVSIPLFTRASWFVPAYGQLAAKLAGDPAKKYIDWRMVLNEAARRETKSENGAAK